MVFDASSKIAVRCSECGEYTITYLNFFKLKTQTNTICKCGNNIFKAYIKEDELILEISCIACDDKHKYNFKIKDIMEKQLLILSCPSTGMEIAFLGKEKYVDKVMERYMTDMYELLKYLGVINKKKSIVVR